MERILSEHENKLFLNTILGVIFLSCVSNFISNGVQLLCRHSVRFFIWIWLRYFTNPTSEKSEALSMVTKATPDELKLVCEFLQLFRRSQTDDQNKLKEKLRRAQHMSDLLKPSSDGQESCGHSALKDPSKSNVNVILAKREVVSTSDYMTGRNHGQCRKDEKDTSLENASSATPEGLEIQVIIQSEVQPENIDEKLLQPMTKVSLNGELRQETGSTILVTNVDIHRSDILKQLQKLVENGNELDAKCTLQLGRLAIFYKKDEGVKMLQFQEGVHDVPIVTSVAKFSDRALVIIGSYLKGAKMTAASRNKTIALDVFAHQELSGNLEVVFARIPREVLDDDVLVYAVKTVEVEGQSLIVRSEGSRIIQFHRHRAALIDLIRTPSTWLQLLAFNVLQVALILLKGHSDTVAMAYQLIIQNLIWWLVQLSRRWIIEPIKCWLTSVIRQALASETREDLGTQVASSSLASQEPVVSAQKSEALKEELPVTDPNWKWPCYEKVKYRGIWQKRKRKASRKVTATKCPFEVMYSDEVALNVTLHSSHLIEIVQQCLPNNEAVFCEKPRIAARDLFLARDTLQKYLSDDSTSQNLASEGVNINEEGRCHLNHLLRFVKEEFKDTLVQYERMNKEGRVSWGMLWTFFLPGEVVSHKCEITSQLCYATLGTSGYGRESFVGELIVMDYNVERYRECTLDYGIRKFGGEVPFTSLQVCPMHFYGAQRKEMEARFRRKGGLFYNIAMQQPFRFMQYEGAINFYYHTGSCWQLTKQRANGRVMIDLLSFARMNPRYLLGNATPPCDVLRGVPSCEVVKKPDEEQLMFAPAIVYGFSFELKQWGCFDVCGLTEINFNDQAFEQLAMSKEEHKEMLFGLVSEYVSEDQPQRQTPRDLISNKGEGCIILCYGPPGTGKTLTAESIAETLHRPLWSMSAFELGSEAGELERKLRQTLDIARTWRAVLLLDEADAYLEKRQQGTDVRRNLIAGVFLRHLEYYSGVLFLTTNRADSFDPAFLSRISLSLPYPPLDNSQRTKIWKTLLSQVGLGGATIEELLSYQLNGRQIRNVIGIAQTWARNAKQQLNIRHVRAAMDAVVDGSKMLHDGSLSLN